MTNASATISSLPLSCSCRRSAQARASVLLLAPAMLLHLMSLVISWRRFADVLGHLERMSDHELAARGISRSDVIRFAMEHSER